MTLTPTKLHLYAAALSSCSARVRIAAHLKQIPLIQHQVAMATQNTRDGIYEETYLRLNPNATVPTLLAEYSNGRSVTLTQSLPMLEFLEESYVGAMRLLPPVTDMHARTKARDLASLVACDIQPPQNLRIRQKVEMMGQDPIAWAASIIRRGLITYNTMLASSGGMYSVGNEITFADVCLYPMVHGGIRVGVDPEELGLWNVCRIMGELNNVDSFREIGLKYLRKM
ncbi:hypothetical protein MMC24_005107 [Lignoscripta atroalba]|nr:hypothetical protein [Lignoscripta atroalba]